MAELPPTEIPLKTEKSDLIHSWGYKDGVLGIVFAKSMDFWEYNEVPEEIAREMKNAKSRGAYFLRYIKGDFKGRLVRKGRDADKARA